MGSGEWGERGHAFFTAGALLLLLLLLVVVVVVVAAVAAVVVVVPFEWSGELIIKVRLFVAADCEASRGWEKGFVKLILELLLVLVLVVVEGSRVVAGIFCV